MNWCVQDDAAGDGRAGLYPQVCPAPQSAPSQVFLMETDGQSLATGHMDWLQWSVLDFAFVEDGRQGK